MNQEPNTIITRDIIRAALSIPRNLLVLIAIVRAYRENLDERDDDSFQCIVKPYCLPSKQSAENSVTKNYIKPKNETKMPRTCNKIKGNKSILC